MKKIIFTFGALALTVGAFFMEKPAYGYHTAAGYVTEREVKAVLVHDNEFLDEEGYLWEYETDQFTIGQHVILAIADQATPEDVSDDVIKGIIEE